MRYHLRRQDKEIKDPEILKRILKETNYVTLALVKEGKPYLVSLSHGYDEAENCTPFGLLYRTRIVNCGSSIGPNPMNV